MRKVKFEFYGGNDMKRYLKIIILLALSLCVISCGKSEINDVGATIEEDISRTIISGEFTVCGGGRYDGLIEEFGGDPTPGIGFGLGIERLLIRLDETGVEIPYDSGVELYVAPLGEKAAEFVSGFMLKLREAGISAETDHMSRGLRAQMKYADKLGAKYTIVLGDNEIDNQKCEIKNMLTGEKTEISLSSVSSFIGGNR